jgi:hypothetical protein
MELEKKNSVPGELDKDNSKANVDHEKKRDRSRQGNKTGSYMRRDRRNSKSKRKEI